MSDWSPLAAGDPVPGDPGAVATLARRLGTTAGVLRTQADRLAGIDPGCWEGEAAGEFRTRQSELAPKLATVARRYQGAASALDRYHPDLHQAQTTARRALAQARQAEADLHGARQGMAAMAAHAAAERAATAANAAAAERAATAANAADPEAPPARPTPWSGPDHHARLGAAQAEMEAARRLLRQAEELRDGAASTCAGSIRAASDDGLADEGGVFGWFKRAASAINDALPVIATVLTVAAAVVGVLALALPALLIGAAVLGALVLGVDAYLWATDRKSGWDVAFDAIGLATLGLGRAFGMAAKASQAAKDARWPAALAYQSLKAEQRHQESMAVVRALSRPGSRAAATGRLRPGAYQRALRKQDFGRIDAKERALATARRPLHSPDRPTHLKLPTKNSLSSGFSPRRLWRDSRDAFIQMRKDGMIPTARQNLDQIAEMWEGAIGVGDHARIAATLAGTGVLVSGAQTVKVGIDASRS